MHNTRALEQFSIITKHVSFFDTTVLDMGCGYGDLAQLISAQARIIEALDTGPAPETQLTSRFYQVDLRWLIRHDLRVPFGYALCMSVLPYLPDPEAALVWMSRNALTSIIECQYKGDGPGTIENDDEMRLLLYAHWSEVLRLGSTSVKENRFERTIWLCRQETSPDSL